MNFIEVKALNDIEELMEKFDGFHDSCIKEMKYVSEAYVNKMGEIHPVNTIRKVEMVFQSQLARYKTIEIQFEKISRMNLEPCNKNYNCIILGASLKKTENTFYWAAWENF